MWKYDHAPHELALLQKLYAWRDRKAEETLPLAIFINLGPNVFMPSPVIKRIVDCFHAKKISTVDNLCRETSYTKIEDTWGQEILHMMNEAVSLLEQISSPFVSTPLAVQPVLQPVSASPGTPTPLGRKVAKMVRNKGKCSRCGNVGHNSMISSSSHSRLRLI